jgi:hypothetical protein
VANTLPNELSFQLIDDTATAIRRSPESIQDTLDRFPDRDLTEVLEAMQALDTIDVGTLNAYLSSEAVLDDSLDSWLEVG